MVARNKFTPLQRGWLEALESGRYKQCAGSLRKDDRWCCLGVATFVVDPDNSALELDDNGCSRGSIQDFTQVMPDNVVAELGARGANPIIGLFALSVHNDDKGTPFTEIAALIRANPWDVFTNFDKPEVA